MPRISNVFRRGAGYWWRRTLSWQLPGVLPITLSFSLWTKEMSVARHRAAAMTAQSEVVRMSVYEKMDREGLKPDDVVAVMRSEMAAYSQLLRHDAAKWRNNPRMLVNGSVDRDLMGLELAWEALAKAGAGDRWPSNFYSEENFRAPAPAYRDLDCIMVLPFDVTGDLRTDTAYRLRKLGIEPNETNIALAMETMLKARSHAAYEVRTGQEFVGGTVVPSAAATTGAPQSWHDPAAYVAASPAASATGVFLPVTASNVIDVSQVPVEWRTLTPTQVAEWLITHNPLMFEHRKGGKRAPTQVGEQTLRQIRWAARLLEMSMNPNGRVDEIRPFYTFTFADLVELDTWFDKLPTTCGKSPSDRSAGATLDAIRDRAVQKIDKGEMCTSVIGLDPMTTNKHIRKLKQVYNCARAAIPAMPEVNFDKFLVPDLKDARDRRDAYTVAQGVELFSLAPFTGCQSVKNRLEPGSVVIHDALFFVPLIVWYTGMRREEVCKLLVSEVLFDEGVWHFSIKNSEAGGIKNLSSRRLVAIADELVRLGLIGYLEAVRAAGHEALFPELVSERKSARKGDVFYKIWWIYLALLMPSLKRGQALHAIRHSFDTELKALEVSPEARADTTGHAMKGLGETRTYSKATKLAKILELVNMVPIVSGHLADCAGINLLPAEMRVPRPIRQKAA